MTDGLSIAIPTFNRAKLLRRTLESLSGLEIPPGVRVELLVINNNCADDTTEVIREFAASAPLAVREVVETEPGLNPCRNRALDEAAFEYVVYFDDDVRIASLWIRGFIEAVEQLGADCVVGPVQPEFEIPPPAWLTPSVLDGLTSSYSRKGNELRLLSDAGAHEVCGCNFGVRKLVAIAVGRFHPDLDRKGSGLVAGGDFEFGMRLAAAGKRVVYQPLCAVTHLIPASKMDREYLRRRWYGLGVTQRRMEKKSAGHSPRVRQRVGLGRLFATAAALRLLGRTARALEWELRAQKALGYFRGA